jgi:uncharacterized protein YjbJ (UPF0337 family)
MNDNNRDDHAATGIDEDRTEGSMKLAGGKAKEEVGKLFGDAKMKHEGQADQAEGKLQNTWGSMKDEAREISGGGERGDNDR